MRIPALFSLSLLIFLCACAEPDDLSTSPSPSEKVSTASTTALESLRQKYDRAVLNCRIDIKQKVLADNKETVESKSYPATLDLLKDFETKQSLQFRFSMNSAETSFTLKITNLTLQNVNYQGDDDSFEAVRSPVIDARLTGKIATSRSSLAPDTKTISYDTSSLIRIYENVNMKFLDLREGPEQDLNFSAKLVCRLEAAAKPEFNGEFRRH